MVKAKASSTRPPVVKVSRYATSQGPTTDTSTGDLWWSAAGFVAPSAPERVAAAEYGAPPYADAGSSADKRS